MIFAGTDLGVFKSTDEGASWVSFNTGFPNVEIYDMKYKESPQVLLAATHGRGCFTFDLSTIVAIQNINGTPESFSISQNYPNPFNPVTTIKYEIPSLSFVTLKIYDALGNEVVSAVNKNVHPGKYEYTWNASGFSSGMYFYKIIAGDFAETKSMILLK